VRPVGRDSHDFNGDGREDIAWSDASRGSVTLWLATSGAPTPVGVDRALPAGGDVVSVSGNTTSDDAVFQQRFRSADLDHNGTVNSNDFKLLRRLHEQLAQRGM